MSFNQSRNDKSSGDSQYRKSGNRSGNAAAYSYQRTNSGKSSAGGGGGPAPPGSLQSGHSYKKSNNVQGGQSRGSASVVNAELNNVAPSRNVQNGVNQQVSSRGVADAPISTASTGTNAAPSAPNSNPAGLKSSQAASVSSDPKLMQTPPKTEGGPPKGFSLQFGSICPGFVNGIQIPPRTSSAPPNLDEQKRDQVHRDFPRTTPAVPLPSIPKHQLAVKEPNVKPPGAGLQRESLVSSPSPSSPKKPSGIPGSSIPMQVPSHLPHGPVQFGVPPQFQPQVVPSPSLQMPAILPKGNSPILQQPFFVPPIQPRPMHHHGIINQGHGINFPNQLGRQMAHQMSNMGINLGRRTVKITHPDTREELRLDRPGETKAGVSSPKAGIQSTIPPQPQPILSLTAPHPSNYNSSSFNSPANYPPMISVPLSTQVAPSLQTARVHYPINQGPGPQSTISSNPSAAYKMANSIHGHAERLDLESTRNLPTGSPSTNPFAKKDVFSKVDSIIANVGDEVNQIGNSNAKQLHGANVTTTPAPIGSENSTGVDASVLRKRPTSTQTQATLAFEVSRSNEGSKKGSMSRSSSIKEQQKKASHKEQHQSQGGGQAIASQTSTLPSDDKPSRITEDTTNMALSGPTKVVSTASSEDHVVPDASGSPKLTISTNSLCGGSGEHVESLQNILLEQVSGVLNEVTKEDVASKENSSVTTGIEVCEPQKGLMESMKVRSPSANEVDLVQSAVCTEKYDTATDDPKPPTPVLESNGSESLKEATSNHVDAINGNNSGFNDRAPRDLNRPKSATAKSKKKMKEVLQKADAAGTTSDLYTAYKGPGEKETVLSTVAAGNGSSGVDVKQVPVDTKEDTLAGKNQTRSKSEPDNWEDADDITSPKLKFSDKLQSSSSGSNHDANEKNKYTKDFLMKFKDQCNILPEGFNIPHELLRALLASNVSSTKIDRSASDRSIGTARSDRRENLQMDDDKWSKGSASFSSRDQRADFGHGNNMGRLRPGPGGNSGVLRYPRGPVAGQHSGGILSGPLQPLNADRWHKANNGLIPSQTPAQMIHKAEKKYEVGKVADEEQAKQRQLKGILNKLTPQNFERLFEQVKAVNIDNAVTLTGVISQIFDKALMEPTFCEMYADFCYHLSGELPDFNEGNEKITFKRVLLNKCQEEFERGAREQDEANKVEEEGEVAQSNEERDAKRVQARRRMLGNIRLIGELYKKNMLTERIMHECIKKLLGPYQNADEEDLEALCKLMSTIGEMIDHPKAKDHMDAYFDMMLTQSNDMKYSSRVRFMLKDSIDLRKNKWQQRRKVEGPKKIEEVHRDAAHERQAQTSRLTRGPSMNASTRRGTSTDFGSRGSSILPSPNSQTGHYRNFPSQARGSGGTQDVRMEDRRPLYENRNMSFPLPQRGTGNDTVTLGPQGGLASGMSLRRAPPAQITPPSAGSNGYRSSNERSAYNSNDNGLPMSASGRLVVSAYSQPAGLERKLSLENGMRSSGHRTDGPVAVDPALHAQRLSEERLRNLSTSAIKEFYSAKDEKEVALCIKDLNTPTFYPSMVALWITDSFERKDMERNLLSRLLVSLTKAHDNTLTHNDLLKGFESVLTTLEDAVNDAPRAPEFLGRIFATVVVENVIPLKDIREIVHKGGEEPGSLVESGLAGDIIGNILEVIQSEKGDSYLNELLSGLSLEDFRPSHPLKSRKLEKFL